MYKLIKGLTQPGQGEAGVTQIGRAVLWSFFGIRKGRNLEQDAAHISPLQVIIAGLIGAALLVLTVATLVSLIVD